MSDYLEEDTTMSNAGSSKGTGGTATVMKITRNAFDAMMKTLAKSEGGNVAKMRLREPDLFHGERNTLVVTTWISTVDAYFDLAPFTEGERFKYAVTLMRGDALLWWNRMKNNATAPCTWTGFKRDVKAEFCPYNSEQAARDKLANLYQTSTVTHYISEFRTLQLQIADMSAGEGLDKFIRGLQSGLRVAVRSRFPTTLESAESMALAIESAAQEVRGAQHAETVTQAQQFRVPTLAQPDDPMDLDAIRVALNALVRSQQSGQSRSHQYGQPRFFKNNRNQVRCFGCQGYGHYKSQCPSVRHGSSSGSHTSRFSQTHRQNNNKQEINALSLSSANRSSPKDGNLLDFSDYDQANIIKDESYLINVNNKEADLPLYEFVIHHEAGPQSVKVLLDTGASANYISPSLVHDSMRVIPLTSSRQVETAGGHVMDIERKVEFSLTVGGLLFKVEAYVFNTKFDIILGRQWFCQAQPIPNWSTHQWTLCAPGGVGTVVLTPCCGPGSSSVALDPTEVYVLGKKQLQNCLRRKEVEEVYLVNLLDSTSLQCHSLTASHVTTASLLQEFQDVFCTSLPPGLPPVRVVEHVIDTGDARPISRPPFKMSPLELDELQKQLKELLSLGLIRPSSSAWGAPVLFVRKKDGTLRMCIDYRAVNSLTQRLRTPLPRIDECLDRLGGAKFFSSLDLKSGYHQVRIKADDVPKTAFNTRYGSFEFMVLPFGLTNSPPTFQKMMNSVLADYLDRFVLVYLDDILIYSKSSEEHEEHVRLVLQKLREHKLFANPKKCSFFRTEVEFLGYRVSASGTLPSIDKIRAVQDWPRPLNVQEVRQFVGLCSHYRRFIPGFSGVAAALTDLTKGSGPKRRPVQWSVTCQEAFDGLKNLMTSAPVLLHPDLTKPFTIETDASDFGVGAVLLQTDDRGLLHPLAYESKKLTVTEQGYPIQEREMLAVLMALRSWRCFIEGSEYVVYTDHNPLQYFRSQVKPTPRLIRWLAEVELYRPDIKYKPGKDNGVPDALSRRVVSSAVDEPLDLQPDYLYASQTVTAADWPLYYVIDIPDNLAEPMKLQLKREKNKFFVQDGLVWRWVTLGDRKIPVQFCPFSRRADLVARFHEGFGHVGQLTVFDLLRKRWWWSTMPADIGNWLSSCPQCQLASGANKTRHHAPMVPSDIPAAFSRWHLDFVGELPLTKKGNRWLLTAVDFATNWPIARAVPDASAETVADFIYEEIVMRFGCPLEIVTDRGANFMSKLVHLYTQRIKVNHKLTSAFHPRTNGKCERLNDILKSMLRKYVHGAIHMWDDFVDAALFATRIRKHRSAGLSPFYLVYGREPVLPGDVLRPYLLPMVANDPRTVAEHTAKELEDLGQARAAAAQRMLAVSEYDKQRWDAAITKVGFEVGDYVLMRNEQKYGLEYNWMGPFIVVEKNEVTNVYKLTTIGGEPCASWVHVDRLKEVKAAEIKEPWYNPTVSRAAWRSEMGLDSHNRPISSHDQSRSLVSVGDDVVSEIPAKLINKRNLNTQQGSQQRVVTTKRTSFKPKPVKRASRPPVVQASSSSAS